MANGSDQQIAEEMFRASRNSPDADFFKCIYRIVAEVRQAEREECAKIAHDYILDECGPTEHGMADEVEERICGRKEVENGR